MNISFPNKNFQSLSAKLITFAFMSASIWFLGNVIMQLMKPPVDVILPALQKQSIPSSQSLTPQKPSYLFGKMETPVTKPEAKLEIAEDTLKQTRLNITLTGILYTPDSSVAIIVKQGQTFVLREGESLSNQVTIVQIQPEFVVLENQGVMEKLQLEQDESIKGTMTSSSNAVNQVQISQPELQKVMAEVQKSPLAINRYVRFRVVNKNGNLNAIQVWPRRERKLFEALGFKNGDKILQVDGVNVSEMGDDPTKLQQLMQRNSVNLLIERKGQQQNLTVSLP